MSGIGKKKSILNVFVSIFFRLILFVGSFIVRRCLIKVVGNDVNGINSLYLSIIGVLTVTDLGIGDAIIFCMYKPIVEGDTYKVSSLYSLFKRIYSIIGLIIAVAGCAVMPFLPHLAKGYSTLDINLYLTFGLMLISTVLTYLFSAKTSLMNAYRDNYITTTITSSSQVLQQILQVIALYVTQSFVWYLICRIIAVLVQWSATEIIARKKYISIMNKSILQIDKDTKSEIVKNVKAIFMHRVGGVLVNTVDSLIISAFIGITILGKYSNYTAIMNAMTGTLILFFTPLTSTIGHLFVQDKEAFKRYYNFFCALNFLLGCIFFLGYYSIIDDLIALLFGTGLELNKSISFVITVNYFIQFMRQSTLLFRDASGTFYYDRWKPLAEGLSNLILSIAFVLLFQKIAGDNFAVVGVIVATIITNIFICHIIEPHVLHKYAFHMSTQKYYMRNYGYIAAFVVLLLVLNFWMVTMKNKWIELLTNGCIAVGLSLIPIVMVIILDRDFRHFAVNVFQRMHKKIKNL